LRIIFYLMFSIFFFVSGDTLGVSKKESNPTSLRNFFKKSVISDRGLFLYIERGFLRKKKFYIKRYTSNRWSAESSHGRYWPASVVKIWAALGAVLFANELGQDSRLVLRGRDSRGVFSSNIISLCRQTLIRGGNLSYDRLLRFVSPAVLNSVYRLRYKLRRMWVSRFFSSRSRLNRFWIKNSRKKWNILLRGKISVSKKNFICRSNCISFSDVSSIMRRLVFHERLSKSKRFRISSYDSLHLRLAMNQSPLRLRSVIRKSLGRNIIVYGKSGNVFGRSRVEIALIERGFGEYYFIGVSMKYRGIHRRMGQKSAYRHLGNQMERLIGKVLRYIKRKPVDFR